MSETIVAPVGGEAPVAAVAPIVDDGASELSIEQAVQLRRQREQEEPAPVEKVEKTAPVEQDELPDEGNAAPEEDPGENAETEPEEHLPPVERPRSWSKDDDDDWNALPRARQEKIAANERAREADINQRINKAAEAAKAAEAKAAEAEQAKQQYFSKLPSMDDLQRIVGNGPFADIKNQDDVTALLKNDPFRYLEWKDYQDKLGGIAAEVQKANQTKAQEKQSKRAAYEAEQSKLLIELVPDMADPKKAAVKRESAVAMLTNDLGLKMEDLQRWMQDDVGHEILSNAGIQKLMDNNLTLKDIQSAGKPTPAAKPLPPVQRPGTSRPASSGVNAQILTLTNQLKNASGDRAIRISAQILGLRRAAGKKG